MSDLYRKMIGGGALLAAVLALGGPAMAITPYDGGFLSISDMENDQDDYDPTNNNPLGDAPDYGFAPGAGSTHTRSHDATEQPGRDWLDARAGRAGGLIEEVASGHRSDAGHQVFTGDGSNHFAIVQFGVPQTNSVVHVGGRENDSLGGADNIPMPLGSYSGRMDLYLDSFLVSTPPTANTRLLRWSVAVNNNVYDAPENAGGYYNENAVNWYAATDGTFYFTDDDGTVLVSGLDANQWVRVEVLPYDGGDDLLAFRTAVYTVDGQLLGASLRDAPNATADVPSLGQFASEVSGGRYAGWFLDPTIPYMFVDNVGWGTPLPEPGSLALLGAGGLLTLARRRKA